MNMLNATPSQKVTAGFLAATGMAIVIALLNQYVLISNPIDGFIASTLPAWFGSLVSYFVNPSAGDVAVSK